MSRLDERKNKQSVVEELSTDTEDLSKSTKVTFTMRKKDIKELEDFITELNKQDDIDEKITKSFVIRKALKLLYKKRNLIFK